MGGSELNEQLPIGKWVRKADAYAACPLPNVFRFLSRRMALELSAMFPKL
jgi:hypothetical protein